MDDMKPFLVLLVVLLTPGSSRAQDWAKQRLDESPRHLEWVKVQHENRVVHCFIAYPEARDKATAVVVIHEIFGLTDWVRGVTDQLAEAGYIAIAPDLLSGTGPNGSAGLGSADDVRKAIRSLPPEQVTADLNAVVDYVANLPASNGKTAVAGFCWGGTQTFRFATNNSEIKSGFVFYGSAPDDADAIAKIACPIYGFYGENDARINATLDRTMELMKSADKTFEPVIYPGAGHGFMRAGEAPEASEANREACKSAWTRWKSLLEKL